MPKYRKLPVVIEAIQWTGENTNEILEFIGVAGYYTDYRKIGEENGVVVYDTQIPGGAICIRTLEGDMYATVGDYIIKGIQGEFYPCKPDIFEKTYELWEYKEDPTWQG